MSIKLLDAHVVEQIAAGEVVESPASVVKELVENSLDAGSSLIEIKIKKSGMEEIRILDNGSGIKKEDIPLAIKRHATSKINAADDLYNIKSLGFRGEALASIAVVAKVTLTTRCQDELTATRIRAEKGEISSSEEAGAPTGTELVVNDLFYNTPARRAFLKSPARELKKITSLITGLALSAPETAFYLWHENKLLFKTKGDGNLLDIVGEAYGNDVLKSMVKIADKKVSDIYLQGYISNPLLTRSNRQYQTLIINGRLVQNNNLSYAVKMGYRGLIPGNRFPVSVIRLTLSPDTLDVNIHPAKTEVRFHNEKEISSLIYKAVTEALGRSEAVVFKGKIKSSEPINQLSSKEIPPHSMPGSYKGKSHWYKLQKDDVKYFNAESTETENNLNGNNKEECLIRETPLKEKTDIFPGVKSEAGEEKKAVFTTEQLFPDDHHRIIGQFDSSYLLAQRGKALVVIDQHAAHERILYEKYRKAYEENKNKDSFTMTAPLTVEIPFNWRQGINLILEYLQNEGFNIEFFGEDTLIVRGVPVFLAKIFSRDFFIELLEKIADAAESADERCDMMIKTAACKEAIKVRKHLNIEEMERLIDDLYKTETPHYCPHGRPIVISMELSELEKSFKRR